MGTVIIGFLTGLGIFIYSITGAISDSNLYIDTFSLILVLGGTVSASLMSITFKNLKDVFKTVKATFFERVADSGVIISELAQISDKAFKTNSLSNLIHTSENSFIQKGVRLLQSELGPQEIRKIMAESVLSEKNRVNQNSDIIKSLAKYPPSFGMVGTILGLIGLLQEMSLSSSMDQIGIKMAMALVTTLYGLLLSNYLLLPLSEVIINKFHEEMVIKKTILESFILIASNRKDPVMVKEYLGVLHSSSNEFEEAA